jgi:hypothetical protein
MYLSPLLAKPLLSPLLPRPAARLLVRAAATTLRQGIRRRDQRQAQAVEEPPRQPADDAIYFAESYHGGVTFWDWVVLPGGGLWYEFCWPLVIETALERLARYPRLRTVLELDGHTYEEMARRAPAAVAMMRRAAASGRLEIANGTYGQPLAQTVSAESNVRHFFYGLRAIEDAVGVRVRSFLAGEPQFFPQAPQIIAGFGIEGAVLRTHWAPFGTDPAEDAPVVLWQGADGTTIRTVPRYGFMRYDLLASEHPGVQSAGLTGSDLDTWSPEAVARFRKEAASRGISRPFLCRSADPKPPESPLPDVLRLTAREELRQVTIREYLDLPHGDACVVSFTVDDFPATIPWGLGGERLHREQTRAEGELLLAERLDALACASGGESQERILHAAWKSLLQAQHHDLHVCGAWHSRHHGRSMADVGSELAAAAGGQAHTVVEGALRHLASQVDASATKGPALLVFNPSPWPRREYVEAARRYVDLPSLGYRVVDAALGDAPAVPAPERALEIRYANRFYSARLHTDGGLYVEADGRCLVTCGGHFTVWKDGAWHDSRSSVERIELVEQGPARCRYVVQGRLADIPYRQFVTMYQELPRIELRAEFDFGAGSYLGPQMADHTPEDAYYVQDEKKLCVSFESPLRQAYCDSPFLIAEPRGPRLIGLSFLALKGKDGRGVALLHRGTPGYHIDRESGVVRNVLAWGPQEWLYASDDSLTPGRSRYTALRDRHVYEYALTPIASRLDALRAAFDYTVPCAVAEAGEGGRSLPGAGSFILVRPEEVLLTALFVHAGKTYARLWNASQKTRRATLRSAADLRARPVSLYLEDADGRAALSLRPWGVQTVLVDGLRPRPA